MVTPPFGIPGAWPAPRPEAYASPSYPVKTQSKVMMRAVEKRKTSLFAGGDEVDQRLQAEVGDVISERSDG